MPCATALRSRWMIAPRCRRGSPGRAGCRRRVISSSTSLSWARGEVADGARERAGDRAERQGPQLDHRVLELVEQELAAAELPLDALVVARGPASRCSTRCSSRRCGARSRRPRRAGGRPSRRRSASSDARPGLGARAGPARLQAPGPAPASPCVPMIAAASSCKRRARQPALALHRPPQRVGGSQQRVDQLLRRTCPALARLLEPSSIAWAIARTSSMPDHPGAALDRVGVAEERVDRVGRRPPGLQGQQRLDHPVEALAGLLADDLEDLGVRARHVPGLPRPRRAPSRRRPPPRARRRRGPRRARYGDSDLLGRVRAAPRRRRRRPPPGRPCARPARRPRCARAAPPRQSRGSLARSITGTTWPRRLRTPRTPPRAGHRRDLAELGHLEHLGHGSA